MQKRVGLAIFILSVLSTVVGAVSVDLDEINSTFSQLTISDAIDLYAYEVNITIDSGTIGTVTSGNFLGSGSVATYGNNQKNGYLFVYGSRLDSSATGISGNGILANITHTGDLTLRGLMAIDSDEIEEYISYNVPAICGNGDIESGEECDDGNTDNGDGCSSTCENEDGIIDNSGGAGGTGSATILYRNTTNTTTRTLIYRESKDIQVRPEEFNLNIVQGVEAEREFFVTYTGEEALEVELDSDGDMIRSVGFEDKTTILYPGEKRIRFGVLVNSKGLKTGNILIIRGNTILKKIPIIANVRSEDFLFDVKMEIPESFRRVYSGENVYSDIELSQVGPQLKVDVVANYILKDFSGGSYYENSETFYVLGEKAYSKEFPTTDLKPGKYVVGLEIVYPGAFAVSSAQFEILDKGVFGLGENAEVILAGAGVVVVASLGVMFWALRRRKLIRKFKRR